MKSSNHIHKFLRHRYKTGQRIYFCINDCNFRISCEFALGKVSLCNRCSKPFTMTKYSSSLEKPHCEECHVFKGSIHPKKGKKKNQAETPSIQPLTVVSDSIGSDWVNNLKQRLDELTSAEPKPKSELSEIKYPPYPLDELVDRKDQPKTVQFKELKLDKEEEFL